LNDGIDGKLGIDIPDISDAIVKLPIANALAMPANELTPGIKEDIWLIIAPIMTPIEGNAGIDGIPPISKKLVT